MVGRGNRKGLTRVLRSILPYTHFSGEMLLVHAKTTLGASARIALLHMNMPKAFVNLPRRGGREGGSEAACQKSQQFGQSKRGLTSCATWEKAPAHAICNAVQLSQSIRSRSPPVAIYFWTLSRSPLTMGDGDGGRAGDGRASSRVDQKNQRLYCS